ncbi:MFS transporter [Secundilactobacillus paracollinoides]|uniref:MFS transporter n=1 Tax=Secundilactobacillus paracollinoides TaxID=240427 RepID=UPI0006F0E4B6|nr:MFS transporter [Secundilactobacillus paracollinoides]KRL79277.1 major facilitator superfamily permease [Secundilactobacillus paracollinoides DSM 15502 = JCM 11969]
MTALGSFLVGSVIAAMSTTFTMLLIGRVLEAIGTGLIIPVLLNTVLTIYPESKRGGAMGLVSLVMTFAPALGPSVSGFILGALSWRWLFILVIPFVILAIIISAIYLKNVTTITRPKIDLFSIVLSTIGFGGVVYGFGNAGNVSWSNPQVYWPLIIGVIFVILFIWRQLRLDEPVLDLSTFTFPTFVLSILVLIALMMVYYSMLSLLPVLLQNAFLVTAFTAGLILLPGSATNGIIAPISGKLFDRFTARAVIIPGLLSMIVAMILFVRVSATTGIAYIIIAHVLLMAGIALANTPNQTNGMNALPLSLYPHGAAAFTTIQQISGAIATALFFSIMSNGEKAYLRTAADPKSHHTIVLALITGMHHAFYVGLAISILAVVVALFIKEGHANTESVTSDND